jgi:diguanylate cyclase (GGDEF)-like protein/PAS domain S-box-containing protein
MFRRLRLFMLHRQLQLRLAALVALAGIALIGAEASTTLADRRAAIANAWGESANLARSLADQAHEVFDTMNIILVGVRERVEADGTSPQALRRLDRLMDLNQDGLPALHRVAVIDEAGHLLASSRGGNGSQPDFARTDYFRHHEAATGRGVLFGWPMRDPQDGSWVITLSCRWDKPDGTFGGVVVTSVSTAVFERFFGHFHVSQDGIIALFRSDGALIASLPQAGTAIGQIVPLPARPAQRAGLAVATQTERGTRLDSYIWLPDLPVTVLVGRNKAEILTAWRGALLAHAAGVLFVLFVLGALAWRLARSIGDSEESHWLLQRGNMHLAESEALTARANRWLEMAEKVAQVGHWHLSIAGSPRLIWSDELFRIHGLDKSRFTLTLENSIAVYHEEDQPRMRGALDRLLANGEPFEVVARILRPDGDIRHVLSRGIGQATENGAPQSAFGVVMDITQQKRTEAELVRANAAAAAANEALAAANHALEAMALQDSLTGLSNRRHFDRALDQEFRRAVRAGTALGMILIDVDRFKQFNDIYGHQAGDACLRAIAGTIPPLLNRPGDIAARYGGEELALLLPGTTHAGAMALAERITQAVRDLGIVHAGSQHGIVTISAGVESLVPARDLDQPPALVEHADLALYAAKRAGRDRVFSYADLYGSAPAAREPRMVRA